MSEFNFDVVVIGSGPSGESAAISCAKNGMRTALIETRPQVGGNCAHKGTIPSKSLRHVVKQIIRFKNEALFRVVGDHRRLTFPQVLEAASRVIPKQVEMHSANLNRNRIQLYVGEAYFKDQNTVEVTMADGAKETMTARTVVIATGSRPYRPADVDFNHPRVYDSDTILEMAHTPLSLIIYGAGVIGCEYASIFAGLGIKVDLLNSRERLLSFLDDEISDALSYHLREGGVMVRHNEEYESVKADASGVTITLKSGKRLRADALLWCNGRTGNTDQLNLDSIGLSADHRGQLAVDENYRTEIEDIYAVGDVIGWPSLASASFDQGRGVAKVICGQDTEVFAKDVPTGIYTLPEISSLGKTERELTSQKVPYEVGRAFFKHVARGQISGEDVGMLKILFHVDTLEILGIHCFGAEASEIIHIGQAIMKQQGEANNINYFVSTTFNYPTMAEAYRQAAFNGLNRVKRMTH
ncbi:Si-specific NAD(P)(+) transhydrogenase [Halioxenophilus aromaticivorans]|uniref:Soluble pyridine nucleotide transhydrogenase n=1 Tax=Halioxenophilus aromaticivorans TaxID=1306992 RepID=A0AAV3TYY1_9ALTE